MRALLPALCLVLALAACGEPEPVDEADKALFLRVSDLASLGVQYANPEASETFTKIRQFDGSYKLTYKFQNAAGQRPLFLFGHITVGEPSDAETRASALKVGLLIGFTKNGVEERELPPMRAGKLTLLVKDEVPIGNVWTVIDGGKTYVVIVSGLHMKEPAAWQKLVDPKLEQLSRYSPDG